MTQREIIDCEFVAAAVTRNKGSITAGERADFVMLAEDLHAIEAFKIKDVKIVCTVGGGTIYQA